MSTKRFLNSRVLAELKPFDDNAHGLWRFNSYVERLEDTYWNPNLALSEQVKFLLALVPENLRGSAKKHLGTLEAQFLSSKGYAYAPPPDDNADDSELFYAPISKAYLYYPDSDVEPQAEGPEGWDPSGGYLTYNTYRDETLRFVCGDFGAEDCFESLNKFRQNGTDIRAHVDDWRKLFDLYVKLSNPGVDNPHAEGTIRDLSLFSNLFYKSLDSTISQSLTTFPSNLEEAYEAAITMSRTNKKRRTLGSSPRPGSLQPATNLVSNAAKPSIHRARASQINVHEAIPAPAAPFPVSNGATQAVHNLSSYLGNVSNNGVQLVTAVCELCHLRPDASAIVKSIPCEFDALRAGVGSALRDNHTHDEVVNAIRNLVPTKYTLQSTTSKHETSEYDNLDSLSVSQLKDLHRKRKLIDSLRANTHLTDSDEDVDSKPVDGPRRTSTRRKADSHRINNLQLFTDDDAHIHTVAAFSVELNALQRTNNCLKCKSPGHYWKDCPTLVVNGIRGEFCPYCKETNHALSACPLLAQLDCRTCKGKGHTVRFCPQNACPKCQGPHPIDECNKFGKGT